MTGTPKRLNLAIQGGGAHGAFAWGILDALLEDGEVDIRAITATSAGAMNAVVAAWGLQLGGPAKAREKLEEFWRRIADSRTPFSPVSLNTLKSLWDPWKLMAGPMFQWFDALSRSVSPYEFNPWDYNPLRDALVATVDFDRLCQESPIRLFLSATDVRTGKVRVFRTPEVTADSVLAAACLPYLYKAVEIGGEAYWDGGFVANPALWPLFYEDLPDDVLICHINPEYQADVPRTSADIMDRLNEISFNASLIAELRAIAFVQKLLENDQLKSEIRDRYRDIHVHAIRADDDLGDLGVETKFQTDWAFLTRLRDLGRAAARRWQESCLDAVGVRSSVNIQEEYLSPVQNGRTRRTRRG